MLGNFNWKWTLNLDTLWKWHQVIREENYFSQHFIILETIAETYFRVKTLMWKLSNV